jgi:hypothetical protein
VEDKMAESLHRTQILLEPEQHQALVELARREGRSVSDIVRELLREQLEQRKRVSQSVTQRRLEALARVRRHREEMLARRDGKPLEVDLVKMLQQMREEQDEHHLAGLTDHRD